jgi:hypothetical protein
MEKMQPRPLQPGQLDLTEGEPQRGGNPLAGRPYLRVYFACANQYIRVYRDPAVVSYNARCPKCGMTKSFLVGAGGTDQRSFTLTCK